MDKMCDMKMSKADMQENYGPVSVGGASRDQGRHQLPCVIGRKCRQVVGTEPRCPR